MIKEAIKNVKQDYEDINPALLWEMNTYETSLKYLSVKKENLQGHEQDLEQTMSYCIYKQC